MRGIKLARTLPAIVLSLLLATTGSSYGQTVFGEKSLVKQHCGACHKPDQQGRVEAIEETRKSPEEWKNVMIRMTRLNGAVLDDAKFYPVVKELSSHLDLTPQEMGKVAYYNSEENSQYREIPQNKMEERIFAACVRCHTFGKISSHRMTKVQWNEIRNLHLGYYPTTVPQMREMDWMKESKDLVPELAKLFPFETEEWKAWNENRKKADIAGKWRVAGYQPGLGYYDGEYEFAPNPDKGEDEYKIVKNVVYANGLAVKSAGTATLFSGYHLMYSLAPTPVTARVEGVFDLDAEKASFEGKWWATVQDANVFGNEKFVRAGGDATALAAFPQAIPAGSDAEQTLTIVGVGLPENATAADISFSDPDVAVKSVVESGSGKIVCKLTVGGDATRTTSVSVKGAALEGPVVLYAKMDGIRILPRIGRSRVSCGAAYPPQGVQFVARGVDFGPDGKPDTSDDVLLEPVDVVWALEEEKTRENDDDLKYLNASIENGLYTPVTSYAPIEERVLRREGVGLIAVAASATIGGAEFKDRAMLAVTVPDFVTHIK